jgi:hypothetical protein
VYDAPVLVLRRLALDALGSMSERYVPLTLDGYDAAVRGDTPDPEYCCDVNEEAEADGPPSSAFSIT